MEYTVRQIAIEGLTEFGVINDKLYSYERSGSIDAAIRQVRKILKEKNIKPIGKGKSDENSKNDGATYSEKVKNNLIHDWMFKYLLKRSNDTAISTKVKELKDYEERANKANQIAEDEQYHFLQLYERQLKGEYTNNIDFNEIDVLTKFDKRVREKKFEIMIEAIFSQYYSAVNVNKLVDDMNKLEFLSNYKRGELKEHDIFFIDRFNDWHNYIEEK